MTNAQTATKAKQAKTVEAKAPKLTDEQKDQIVECKIHNLSSDMRIVSRGGEELIIKHKMITSYILDIMTPGHSMAKLKQTLGERTATLAKGVDSRNSPHSAKAVADGRAMARATNKADGAMGRAKVQIEKKEARKAERAKASGNRPYKALVKVDTLTAKPGSWRRAMLECVLGSKDTDSANACIAKNREWSKNKIDFRWCAAQKFIEFTD